MAPPLTEQQKNIDHYIDQALIRWFTLDSDQRARGGGDEIKNDLKSLVQQRNGPEAANEFIDRVEKLRQPMRGELLRQELDEFAPTRLDGGNPGAGAPQPEQRPAAAQPPNGVGASGSHGLVYAAEPGDGRVWLPGNASFTNLAAGDKEALQDRDNRIEALNSSLFNVDPAQAWRPSGAELTTGNHISTLNETHSQAADLMGKFAAAVGALETAFTSGSSAEPVIAEQWERVRPALDTLKSYSEDALRMPELLSRATSAANAGFHQLRDENIEQRKEVGSRMLNAPDAGGNRTMFSNLPEVNAPTYTAGVDQAVNEMKTLVSRITPTNKDVTGTPNGAPNNNANTTTTVGNTNTPVGTRPGLPGLGGPTNADEQKNPAGTPNGAVNGATAGAVSKGLGSDEIAKLLNQLSTTAAQVPQQVGQQLGQIPQQLAQIPQQLAQIPQQLAQIPQQATNALAPLTNNPSDMLRQLRGEDPVNAQLTGAQQEALKDADSDRAAATQVAFTPPKPAESTAVGAPGSPARPNQLDALGRPVDQDGDGKVDSDAVALSKNTVKPFDLSVPADGQNVQVKGVPDPRIGEMMLHMADTKDGESTSVLEAAKAAGMEIPALGDPLDPKLAEVGDAVIGDEKTGMYLGDGKVLTSSGDVEDLDAVLGENGFVSQIPLPELPQSEAEPVEKPETVTVADTEGLENQSAPTQLAGAAADTVAATPPVSAPEPFQVPPPPPLPPVSSPPEPAPPAEPEPAPEPAPVSVPETQPEPAPVSETAGDGLPRQVPYEGRPLGG